MNEKQPIYKRKWFAYTVAILLVLSAFSLFGGNDEEEQAEQSEETPKQAIAEDKAEVQAEPAVEKEPEVITLADAVNEYLGDRRIHGQSVKDGYYTIQTDFGDFVSRERSEEESVDLAQLVSEHAEYMATGAKGVMVEYISGVTDAYGNSKDDTIMFIGYTNETIAKINFDNFDTDNVVTVADEYFRMASFK